MKEFFFKVFHFLALWSKSLCHLEHHCIEHSSEVPSSCSCCPRDSWRSIWPNFSTFLDNCRNIFGKSRAEGKWPFFSFVCTLIFDSFKSSKDCCNIRITVFRNSWRVFKTCAGSRSEASLNTLWYNFLLLYWNCYLQQQCQKHFSSQFHTSLL